LVSIGTQPLWRPASFSAKSIELTTADTALYRGDIDRAGLQCLAAIRRTGVSVTSILMDLETLQRYRGSPI
jgi:hypothetical protein